MIASVGAEANDGLGAACCGALACGVGAWGTFGIAEAPLCRAGTAGPAGGTGC